MSWQKKLTPLGSELTSADPRAATLLAGEAVPHASPRTALAENHEPGTSHKHAQDVLVMREKAEDMLFDDKKKGDEEEGKPVEVVIVSDEEVIAGRKTRIGLVIISIAMFALCVGMLLLAQQLTVVVGGSCGDSQDRYHNYEHCWNLKENWCAQTQAPGRQRRMGTAIDPSTLNPADPNVCPGLQRLRTEAGQTEKWIEQLKWLDAPQKHRQGQRVPSDDGPRRQPRQLPRVQDRAPVLGDGGVRVVHPARRLPRRVRRAGCVRR